MTPGYSSQPLDLAEAEVESDPDLPNALPQERNLLIEYSTHVPYMYSQAIIPWNIILCIFFFGGGDIGFYISMLQGTCGTAF